MLNHDFFDFLVLPLVLLAHPDWARQQPELLGIAAVALCIDLFLIVLGGFIWSGLNSTFAASPPPRELTLQEIEEDRMRIEAEGRRLAAETEYKIQQAHAADADAFLRKVKGGR